MPQKNVDLLHRANDAVNRQDLDGFVALMDDEVEAVPRLVAIEGDYRGHEGIRRWWRSLFEAFPDYTVAIVEAREVGDLTLASLRWHGHGASSEAPFDATLWQVIRWRDGKATWWRVFESRAEALDAAGVDG